MHNASYFARAVYLKGSPFSGYCYVNLAANGELWNTTKDGHIRLFILLGGSVTMADFISVTKAGGEIIVSSE